MGRAKRNPCGHGVGSATLTFRILNHENLSQALASLSVQQHAAVSPGKLEYCQSSKPPKPGGFVDRK